MDPTGDRRVGPVAAGPAPDSTFLRDAEEVEAVGGPVTAVFTWEVLPGHEAEIEEWAHGITAAGSRYPGHLGATWLRPGPGSREYHTVLKFSDQTRFRAWMDSPERADWIHRAERFSRARRTELTGLETWFTLPGRPARSAPPRWKMFLVTAASAYPVSLLLTVLLFPRLGFLPMVVRPAISTVLLVGVLTWVVLPRVTRFLEGWLYPAPGPAPGDAAAPFPSATQPALPSLPSDDGPRERPPERR